MTLLVASVAAETAEQAAADVIAAAAAGADLIELRVDYLADCEDVVIRSVAAARPAGVPLLLTIRSAEEGGRWDAPDQERISRLIALGPIADWIDVEFATWERSANIRQKVGLARRDGRPETPARLLLSAHDFQGRPARLHGLLTRMYESGADAIKIVWKARTIRDNFEALDLLRAAPEPTAAFCMGSAGQLSRVLARKFNAFASYAAVSEERAAAPGQLTLADLKRRCRWDRIGAATRVFGVVGHPLAHSLSPAVHNAAFDRLGIDAVYLPLPVEPGYEPFKAFMVEVLARPWLDFDGLSVTLPHKENALRFVRESGGIVEPAAARIGAVNTIRLGRGGHPEAFNTDAPAALSAIAAALGRNPDDLRGVACVVLGAGGVARAIVASLTTAGAAVRIFNRTTERAAQLSSEFGCPAPGAWEQRGDAGFDLLVNCTAVGLAPAVEDSPFPADALRPTSVVMDTIYNPRRTRLLRDAAAAGCRCIDGLAMFLHQAVRQFELWTGRPAPPDAMTAAADHEMQT